MADPVSRVLATLRTRPEDPAAWSSLGEVLLGAGAVPDAIEAFQKAATLQPTGRRVFRLASALQQAGHGHVALPLYQQAVGLDPGLAPAWHNLGGLLAATGALAEAEDAFVRVVKIDRKHARAWCNLGVVRRRRGRIEQACRALKKAIALRPDYGLALANLAGALEQSNQPGPARAMAQRALKHAPGDPVARLVLARLARDAGDAAAALAHLDGLPAADAPADQAARVHGERGQALDRLGRSEEAFAAFTQANAARASTPEGQHIDPDVYPATVARWIDATAGLLADAAHDDTSGPVFLIGFPRSGTTLTERILVAHPDLRGSDEAPLLEHALQTLDGDPRRLLDPAAVPPARAAYARLLSERLGASTLRLVDKLPLNLVHLGAIARLFPTSPVITVLRDPRDAALSCFMQDFVLNPAMVQMLDLNRIVALQEQVLGLWLASRDALPNPWIEVRYEDVVADQPAAARRLLDHVGLPWDDRVTRYWEGAAGTHISTPSHQDVGKPIFTRARGRWRRYEAALAPVRDRLDVLAEALGYPV